MGRKGDTYRPLVLHPRPGWQVNTAGRLARPFVTLFAGCVPGVWVAWLTHEVIPGWRAWRITVWPVFRDAARWASPFLTDVTEDLTRCAVACYGAAFLFLALLLFLWKTAGHRSVLLVVLLGMVLGMGGAFLRMDRARAADPWLGHAVRCEGRVGLSAKYENDRDVYLLRVHTVFTDTGQAPAQAWLRLEIEGEGRTRYQPGDRLLIEGTWEAPPPASNPGGFDYCHSLMVDGVGAILRVTPAEANYLGGGHLPVRIANHARTWLSGVYERYAGEHGASLLQAMIVGERWQLPGDVYEGFVETGMAHLLAISGLHVGFLAACLWWVIRRLHVGDKAAFFCLAALLPFYALLTGAGVSVIRAAMMVLIVAGGRALRRRTDLMNSLCVAGLVILAFRPLDILDVGFQLSFCALLGLILLMPLFRRLFAFLPVKAGDLLAMSLAAQLGVAPVLAWHFHGIAPASLAANLVLIPLAGLFINLGFLLPLISWIPLLPKVLGFVLNWTGWLMLWLNDTAASLLGYRHIPSPGWVFLAGYYLVLFFVSGQRPLWARKRWRWGAGVAAVTVAALLLTPILDCRFTVVFVDVGQGACVYVRTPDERHFLMDAGGNIYGGEYDPGASRVAPFLLGNGVGQLDLAAVSHAHEDHIGGMPAVLASVGADRFVYYLPAEPDTSWPLVWETLTASGTPVQSLAAGDAFPLGGTVTIRTLYPPVEGPVGSGENNRSLCLLFVCGDASVMLVGDIEAPAEGSAAWPHADIVQMPHHGSNTSSTISWIEAVSPAVAVAQAGPNNPYRHPASDVLERYRSLEVMALRNDQDGAVVCECRDGRWTIYGVKGATYLER